jgi:hypothetical protein
MTLNEAEESLLTVIQSMIAEDHQYTNASSQSQETIQAMFLGIEYFHASSFCGRG